MLPEEIRKAAHEILADHLTNDFEYSTVYESEELPEDVSDEDMEAIHALICRAAITFELPE